MLVKLRQLLLKNMLELIKVLLQQGKMFLVEALKPLKFRFIATQIACFSHSSKEPKSLFFIASIDEHDESNYEIHTLAVPYFIIMY